jgi:hypothetical protein
MQLINSTEMSLIFTMTHEDIDAFFPSWQEFKEISSPQ